MPEFHLTLLRAAASGAGKAPVPEISFMARDVASAKTLAQCIITQNRFGKGMSVDEALLEGPAPAHPERWTRSAGWAEALEPVTSG